MKRIVGIAPAPLLGIEETNFKDYYKLGNNYILRAAEAGCVPMGLAPVNLWLPEEALGACDAFLIQGGAEFYPYHFQIIHHAYTRGKRYLGICLGQQLIYVYFELMRRIRERGYEGDPVRAICAYLEEQGPHFTVQGRTPNHCGALPKRGEEDACKHDVDIVPGTLLHRVLGRERIRIASFHQCCTPATQTLVTINAISALGDGIVEGTEYGDHILGVQGHPEVDGLLPELFRFLAGE